MKTKTAILLAMLGLSVGFVLWKTPGAARASGGLSGAGWVGQWNLSCTADPVVTSFENFGAGTLRQAVADACPGSTITFQVAGTIQLSSAQIVIDKNLTIQGPGAHLLNVRNTAPSVNRVFMVSAGVTATIAGITISGGNLVNNGGSGESGGGIYNLGNLTLTDSVITDNRAAGGNGGGIYNSGSAALKIINTTISANSAGSKGGGIYTVSNSVDSLTITGSLISNNLTLNDDYRLGVGEGGGIYALGAGKISLTNTTISGNKVSNSCGTEKGAGIYNALGTLSLTGVTITNNSHRGAAIGNCVPVVFGSGIYSSGAPAVNIRNSIIAENKVEGSEISADINSQGYNLLYIEDNTEITGDRTGDIYNQNPRLLPLADNGGPTLTHGLEQTSPAVDAGNSSGLTIDQRGAARPADLAPPNISDGADIGAFELAVNENPLKTIFTSGPGRFSNRNSAAFTFTGTPRFGVSISGYECSLDGGGFAACASGQSYASLAEGAHTLTVRTLYADGVVGAPTPYHWTIEYNPPETTISTAPGNPSSHDVRFTFSGVDDVSGIARFECELDGGGFLPCQNPHEIIDLLLGSHTLRIRAVDGAGNTDPTPATHTWTVDSQGCLTDPVVISNFNGGRGSLRWAAAAACPGSTVTFNVPEILLSTQVTIDKNLTLQGSVTVRNIAADYKETNRIFYVRGGVTAAIEGLIIKDAKVAGNGAGIYTDGTLTLTGVTITNNRMTARGGGIYNNGTLTVINSTVSDNGWIVGLHDISQGSGIYNNGALTITGSTLSDNKSNPCPLTGTSCTAPRSSAGIHNNGTMSVANSTFRKNWMGDRAGGGGAIFNFGTLNVSETIFDANDGGLYEGTGAIYSQGGMSRITVTNSTFTNNEGGVASIHNNGGTATVTGSTFSNNISDSVTTNTSATLCHSLIGTFTLTNSTVTNNITRVSGTGGGGGGISVYGGTMNIINSTISKNEVQSFAGGLARGGGVYHGSGTVNVRNSIIAGNKALNNSFGPDFYGTMDSQGYNIIGNNSGTRVTGNTTGNIVGTGAAPVDARLAPLGFYGGKTLTHALLSGSPAINAGDPTVSIPDQRGALRVGTPDIGAFELNNSTNGGNFLAQLPYTDLFTLTPDRGAFNYSLSGGALPNGYSLTTSGAVVSIGGSTNQTGNFDFAVTATDGASSNMTNYRLNIPEPNAPVYNGYHESAGCDTIGGWAWDARQPDTPVSVDIYADGSLVATVSANQFRQDLLNAGIGNGVHGFSLATPASLKDGQAHSIRVRYAQTSIDLSDTPKSITCSVPTPTPTPTPTATPTPTPTPVPTPNYGGYHEVADCNQISGWAWDSQQPNTPISVDIYADGNLLATVLADQFRQDLLNAGIGNGAHVFSLATPANLKDGQQHEIRVRYAGTSIDLSTTPKSITCSAPTPTPTPTPTPVPTPDYGGFHEAAACSSIGGWAWDAQQPNTPINVGIYADGSLLATVSANQFRQDLLDAGKGNGAHAFSLATPASLKDGQPHEIRVRYAGTNIDLGTTPKSLTCSAPTPTPTPTVSVAGSLTYGTTPAAQTAKPVSGVLLSASGASSSSASSDSSGAYLLGNLLSGGSYTVTPSKSGDVNSISSFDASLVSRYAANPQGNPLTANQLIAADASGNGQVTSFDASFIARTAAGIANNGIAGQWRFVPASKSYTNLTSNQTGENYTAILIGEVSGNWTPPSGGNAAAPNLSSAEQKQADLAEEQMYQENLNLFSLGQPAYKNWLMPLFSGGATAASGERLSLEAAGIAVSLPANASASNGTVAVIPVTVGDTTNQGIFSFDFTVSFDPNVLTPASSSFDTTGTLAGTAGFTITANTSVPGQITISGFGTQPLSGAGTLINLRFNVIGTANTPSGSTNLMFNLFVFNEGDPQAMTANGQFTVTGPTAAAVTVSGRVISGRGRGVARARVSFTDAAGNRQTAITNPFGYYRFEAVEVGITYVFEARAKGFEFAPQIVYLTEEMTNLNFTAVAERQSP